MRWLTSAESAGGGNNEKGELMTNQQIMSIAMRQSALDLNADISDFTKEENVFVKSGLGALARKYYSEPIACN